MEQTIVRDGVLEAPFSYWHLSYEEKDKYCNGCGPSLGTFAKILALLIPDQLYGLSIMECCNIHDYCYYVDMPKDQADMIFFENMNRTIDAAGGWLKGPRHVLAFHYFLAVKNFGSRYYDGST